MDSLGELKYHSRKYRVKSNAALPSLRTAPDQPVQSNHELREWDPAAKAGWAALKNDTEVGMCTHTNMQSLGTWYILNTIVPGHLTTGSMKLHECGIRQCFSGINKYNGRAQVNPRASAVNRLYLSYYSVTHCLGNDANSKRTLPACVLSACSWLSADITDCDSFFRRIRSSKKSGSWDEFTSQAKKHARSSLQLHPLILHMSETGSSLFKFRQDQIYILRVIKTKN